jgi:predicted aspartyl protease
MKRAYLIFLFGASLPAAQEIVVRAERMAHLLVLPEVYVNGAGPFRMMIDTGNASSLIRPSLARKLGVRPAGSLEHATASGCRLVPAALLDEVRIGNVIEKMVEVMIADVQLSGVDGVLGQSWLIRHDYLLDYQNHRLVLDGPQPSEGVRAHLRSSDGRPAILTEVDGRREELIVDSGAQLLVLFERSPRASQALLLTNSHAVQAGTGSVKVAIGESYRRSMPAARVNASVAGSGLLPAGIFRSVYVSNREGAVVLIP